MTLHLIKLCVGAESIADLAEWQQKRLADARRRGDPVIMHVTRQRPRRPLDAGSSLYWVIKGFVQVRQRITELRELTGEDGFPRCGLVLDPQLVPTERQPRRPFQGWRYLEAEDAPADLRLDGDDGASALPPAMRRELYELRLL